jgi:hypothetical protein
MSHTVIPDLIRNPGTFHENLWIPAFTGMTYRKAVVLGNDDAEGGANPQLSRNCDGNESR